MPTIFEQLVTRAKKEDRAPLTFDSKSIIDTSTFTSTPSISARPGEELKPSGISFEPSRLDKFVTGTVNVAKVIGGAIKAVGQAAIRPESRKLFRKSLETGELATIGALKSTAGLVARKLGADQLAQKLDDVARQSREGVEAMQAVQRVFREDLKITDAKTFSQKIQDPNFIAEGLGMNLPNMIAAMGFAAPAAVLGAPAAIVGGLGFISASAIEGGFARQEALKAGATEEQADRAAVFTGVANGILETLPITRLLNKLGPAGDKVQRNILSRIIKGIVTQATLEAGTESLQEIVQNAVARGYDENRDLLQGVPEAGFFGLLMGGGMEVVTTGAGGSVQGIREGKIGLSIEDVSPEFQPLAEEARKYKTAEEFIDGYNRKMEGFEPFGDFTKIPKEQQALSDAFQEFAQSPEIQIKLANNKTFNDMDILTDIWNKAQEKPEVKKQPLEVEARKFIQENPEATAEEFVENKDVENNTIRVYNEIYGKDKSNIIQLEGTIAGERTAKVDRRRVGEVSGKVERADFKGLSRFVNENPDGFTISVSGNVPTEGFVVYPFKGKEVIVDKIDGASLRSFVLRNSELLSEEGNFFGGWKNPKDGKFYLDVSKVINNIEDSLGVAVRNNQISIFDLKSGKALNTVETIKSQLTDIFNKVKGEKKAPPKKRPPTPRELGIAPEPAPKITRREDVLLRERLRSEQRGAKFAAKEGKKVAAERVAQTKEIERHKAKQTLQEAKKNKDEQLKEYKKNLKNRQDEVLALLDKLPPEYQGRMKKAIQTATTQKRILKLQERVKNRIRQNIERETISEAKTLARTAKVEKITPKYQRLISDLLRDYDFKKPTDATIKRLTAMREFLESNPDYPMPDKYIEQLRRLEQKNVREMSIGDVKELNETLRSLIANGKEIQKHRVYMNRLKFQNEMDTALASTKNLDFENDALNKALTTEHAFEFTFRVADKVDGDKLYDGWHARFVKDMGRKVNTAEIEQTNRMADFLGKHSEVSELTLDEKQQKEIAAHLYNDQGGTEQTAKIIKELGLTELPQLTTEQEQVRDLLVETAKQKTDRIQPLWETTMVDDKGRPMAFETQERYFPFYYEERSSDLGVYSILQDYKVQSRIQFGSGFSRKAGVELTPRTDIYKMLQEAVAKQELFLNLQPQLFEKGTIFRTQDYQNAAGKVGSKYWVGYIDEVSRNGFSSNAVRTPVDGALRKGRQNVSRGLLDLSFSTTLIQPFAILDAMGYMTTYMEKTSAFKLLTNLVQSFVRPNFAKKTIEQSLALQTRRGGEEVIKSFDDKAVKKGVKLTENQWQSIWRRIKSPFAAIQFFDIRTAAAVQKTAVDELAKTMPLDVAQAEADFIMDLLSGSSNIAYRPRIMNGGELGRALTTFQTFVLNEWGLITQDIIKKGVIKGGVSNSMKIRLWAVIGLGFFFLQGYLEDWLRNRINNAVKGTEHEANSFLKSVLLYIPERIPVLGNIVKGVEYGRTGIPIPVVDIFTKVIEEGFQTFTTKDDKKKLINFTQMLEAIGVLLGVPAKEAQNIIERLIEESAIGEETRESIRKETIESIESGEMSVSVAKDIFFRRVQRLEAQEKEKVFDLSDEEYRTNLIQRIVGNEISVSDAKKEFIKYVEKNKEKVYSNTSEQNFIEKIVNHSKALGTDPVTFFKFIFSGERIRKTRGNAIIVERIPLEESEKIKKELGSFGDMRLDHTIPLGLGGSNSKSNLKLVTLKDWEKNTPIEVFLINALEEGKIKRKEAQQFIKDFKSGKISEEEVYANIR